MIAHGSSLNAEINKWPTKKCEGFSTRLHQQKSKTASRHRGMHRINYITLKTQKFLYKLISWFNNVSFIVSIVDLFLSNHLLRLNPKLSVAWSLT